MRLRKLVPALALASFAALPTAAQSLRGSPASVDRMYREAQEHDLYFFRTPGGVRRAVERGDLVRMSGSGATCFALYRSHDVMRKAAETLASRRPRWWQLASELR